MYINNLFVLKKEWHSYEWWETGRAVRLREKVQCWVFQYCRFAYVVSPFCPHLKWKHQQDEKAFPVSMLLTCLLSRYPSYLLRVVKVGWSFVIHAWVFREISLTSPGSGNGHPSENSFQTLLVQIWFESQIKGLAWNLFSSWFFLVSMSVETICIPFILGIILSVD